MGQFIFACPFPDAPAHPVCDALLTDPPYSRHVHASAVSQSAKGGARKRDLGFPHITADDVRRTAEWAARATRRWSVIYSDVESTHVWRAAIEAARGKYIRTIPWIRWSMPQLSGDRPPTGREDLTVGWGSDAGEYFVDPGVEDVAIHWGAATGAKSWNGLGNLTHLNHLALRGDGKHGAEKPLDQALDLVEFFTNPGEHVVDLYAGSGTFGLACKILGRIFTGYEREPRWAWHGNERISKATVLGDTVIGLSARDAERHSRYLEARAGREGERKRLAEKSAEYAHRARAAKEAAT